MPKEYDWQEFRAMVAEPSHHNAAFKRAAMEHLSLIQMGMDAGGVDPETGQAGVWPAKVIPGEGFKNFPGYKSVPNWANNPRCTLQATGDLMRSITFETTPTGYVIGPRGLPYAEVHQFGASIPISDKMRGLLRWMGFSIPAKKTTIDIPARPYMIIPDMWLQQILDAFLSAYFGV